jgi:peptidyl-prolyl cis-trans isomerase D
MRRNSRSVLIYIIFGILIAVFIISFGPQSGARARIKGGSTGCATDETYAAKVNGRDISENSWRYGILHLTGGSGATGERARKAQIREVVTDQLLVREILAQDAEQMGFRLSDDEIKDKLINGDMYILGQQVDPHNRSFVQEEGEEKWRFKASALDNYARYLGLGSVDKFIGEQRRELLAQKMRELVLASVRVSPEEALHHYEVENNKVDFEYVAFQPTMYGDDLELTPADVDAYATAHEADLKKQYDKDKDRYQKRDKEVRYRDILIKKTPPTPPAAPPASSAASSAPAPAEATKPDEAKAKATAALERLKKGEDFAVVAKAVSEDERTAKRGGDMGWRKKAFVKLGDQNPPELEKGKFSDVIEASNGYHILELVDTREGDLTYDMVKSELAETAMREEKTRAAAKADAEKAYAAAKGGTELDKLFPDDPKAPRNKPRLQKGTDVTRVAAYVPGIGKAPEVMTALFEQLKPGELGPKVYEIENAYFIVRLTKHTEPDMKKYEEDKAKIAAQMTRMKGMEVLAAWEGERCREVAAKNAIEVEPSFVEYGEGADPTKKKTTYTPCMTFRSPEMQAGSMPIQIE